MTGAAVTLNLSNGNYFYVNVTTTTSITVTNPPGAGVCPQFKLVLANATASTNYTVTFPTNMKVKGRVVGGNNYNYTLNSAASVSPVTTSGIVYDIFEFTTFDGGTTYIQTSLVAGVN